MARLVGPDEPRRREWRLVGFSIAWAVFCLAADAVTGPGVQFGALYAIPVVVAAWEEYLGLALAIAWLLPIVELFLDKAWGSYADIGDELFTTVVRMIALTVLAMLVQRFSKTRVRVERRLALPAGTVARCESCGRVQDADGRWWSLDDRIVGVLAPELVPARCPECAGQG